MAWTGRTALLSPGAKVYWSIRINGGADFGAQLSLANPLNPGGVLRTYHQSKKREDDGSTTYLVTVENVGSVTTNYNLQGGGLT
jgi:hypothetical protein